MAIRAKLNLREDLQLELKERMLELEDIAPGETLVLLPSVKRLPPLDAPVPNQAAAEQSETQTSATLMQAQAEAVVDGADPTEAGLSTPRPNAKGRQPPANSVAMPALGEAHPAAARQPAPRAATVCRADNVATSDTGKPRPRWIIWLIIGVVSSVGAALLRLL